MRTLETHFGWLRRYTLSNILLTAIVIGWSAAPGVISHRMIGITLISVDGRPAVLGDELLLHGLPGVFHGTFLHCLFILTLFVGRVSYRWWLVGLILVAFGTPLALLINWQFADYLWKPNFNLAGVFWEGSLTPAIGVLFAWVVALFVGAWLNRYYFVIIRRSDVPKRS